MDQEARRWPHTRTAGAGWRTPRPVAVVAAIVLSILLAGCAGPPAAGPPAGTARPAEPVAPLPPTPWRDASAVVTRGTWQWTDAQRGRTIEARWIAATEAQALVLVLPGLAQGDELPRELGELLAQAGFAVVALGHPGNEAARWLAVQRPASDAAQGPKAAAERQAEFKLAARRMFAPDAVAERAADVRAVLDAIAQSPPPWLAPAAARRVGAIGVIGIGLGAQTVQGLIGEQMARGRDAAVEPRIAAAALVGPFVGFDGPAMHQRYRAIRTPLLVAYGMAETDPFGLGMTAQQRRAMIDRIDQARVVELRLPTMSSPALLVPSVDVAPDAPTGLPPLGSRDPARPGGPGPMSGASGPMPPGTGAMPTSRADAAAMARADASARVALLFSLSAFFEAELLGSGDAREWLDGPHPGPARWTLHPAGRAAAGSTQRSGEDTTRATMGR